jgi:hypothetical protein
MSRRIQKTLVIILLVVFLVSCGGYPVTIPMPSWEIPLREIAISRSTATATPLKPTSPSHTATAYVPPSFAEVPTNTPTSQRLWIDPAVPESLVGLALSWNLPHAPSPTEANLHLTISSQEDSQASQWFYALVAPFPTVLDGVSLDELRAAWFGSTSGPLAGAQLWMADSTRLVFADLWGEPSPEVVVTVPADSLIDSLWKNRPAWGIVPFESLDPKLKVLTINDQSPIRNDFNEDIYPLKVRYTLAGNPSELFKLPATNRDPEKLSVVLMTGVTALVRATAVRMDYAGVNYPARDIGDTLRAADITHISNEIPFYSGCPQPDGSQEGLVFCSNPNYIELLKFIGTDIVELTGNHFEDYGPVATLQTLSMYNEIQWPYYGGGANLEDSQKPAFLEHNGNRFAFIGCNPVGPKFAWATERLPGAAPCGDYEWIKSEITKLKAWGYIVITTFQYVEYYQSVPTEQHISDFRAIADAGATIVNGSQAHIPQAMEFYDTAFVHYGLGNLFFDQMSGDSRREFLDRHTFYDGRYISTELVTALLEDFARPRPMTPEERERFLKTMFSVSGW